MNNAELRQKLIDVCVQFISYARRSEWEVRRKLASYLAKHDDLFADEKLLDDVVAYLCETKLLDDSAYVADYVTQALTSPKPLNATRIRIFLQKKGIQKDLIDHHLKKLTSDAGLVSALRLAEKQFSRLRGDTQIEKKKRLWQYLARKGFSGTVIRTVIDTSFKLN